MGMLLRRAFSGGLVTDPYFSSVVLLMHMEGSNGGTTFTDSSNSVHTLTPNSGTTATASAKFGLTGLSCIGASGSGGVTVSGSLSDFTFTGDFTVEAWVLGNPTALDSGAYRHVLSGGSVANSMGLYMNTSGFAAFGDDSIGSIVTGTSNISGVYTHVAYSRASNTGRLFVNGVQQGSSVSDSKTWAVASSIAVGHFSGTSGRWQGDIDELRVTKVARYTTTFTPPTAAFPNS